MQLNTDKLYIDKGNIAVCLFVIPFISRWIFPSSLELLLTVDIFEIPVYILDLMYFMIPFLVRPVFSRWRIFVVFLLILYLIVGLLGHLSYPTFPTQIVFLINQPIIFAFILIVIYPFTKDQIFFVKNIFIVAFIILSLEIVLGTLGVVDFGTKTGYTFNDDIFRISTTIGAATGTGVVVFMLGGLIISLYLKDKKNKVFFVIVFIIAISLTISRGPFLAMVLFFLFLLLRELRDSHNKFLILSAVMIIVIVLSFLGLFDPMIDRAEIQEGDISTGRDASFIEAMELIKRNLYVGCGFGNIFQEKDLLVNSISPQFYIPTHNYYLIIMGETGLIGALLLGSVFVILLCKMDYGNSYICYVILITHVVLMNVEGVFVWREYAFMLAFLYSIGINRLEHT